MSLTDPALYLPLAVAGVMAVVFGFCGWAALMIQHRVLGKDVDFQLGYFGLFFRGFVALLIMGWLVYRGGLAGLMNIFGALLALAVLSSVLEAITMRRAELWLMEPGRSYAMLALFQMLPIVLIVWAVLSLLLYGSPLLQ